MILLEKGQWLQDAEGRGAWLRWYLLLSPIRMQGLLYLFESTSTLGTGKEPFGTRNSLGTIQTLY